MNRKEAKELLNLHVTNLFPIPFMVHMLRDDDLADLVEEEFLKVEKDIPRISTHSDGNQYTNSDWDKIFSEGKDPIFNPIKIEGFMNELNLVRENFAKISGIQHNPNSLGFWTQDYVEEGDQHGRHNHGAQGISGVYFIRAEKGCGELQFYNPNPYIEYCGLSENISKHNFFGMNTINIAPKKGLFILFPSYLQHAAQQNPAGIKRTVFAFNYEN